MPISIEPGQGFPLSLIRDKSKPEATRPTFFAKSQSMGGFRRCAAALDIIHEGDRKLTECHDAIIEQLGKVLTGWRNVVDPDSGQPIDYSPAAIGEVLTYMEAREILYDIASNAHVTEDEKKG